MNSTLRLTLGLGTILIGVLAALPFRHREVPEDLIAHAETDQPSLGNDVALQVPGQSLTPDFQPLPTSPDTAEQDEERTESEVEPSNLSTVTQPPSLPDEYLPLFGSEPSAISNGVSIVQQLEKPTVPALSAPALRPLRKHTIHDGDTLESLAARYLQDRQKAIWILEANRSELPDPNILPIGQEIVIPDRAPTTGPGETASPSSESSEQLVPLPQGAFRQNW